MESDLRLHTSKHAFPVYDQYCGEDKLFPQKSYMYFWCVVLVYRQSPDILPPKLGRNRKGEVHYGAFDEEVQKPFLKMIAVEANQDFKILSKESDSKSHNRFRDIIQSYAELGFSILNTQMGGKYTADKLMELLIDNSQVTQSYKPKQKRK